jgi:branched-chain amino acid aminotransferase
MNGITRNKVIELCHKHGTPAYEKNFSLTDVYDADEAFVTGTFGGLTPVNEIDGRNIGGGGFGPLTQQLRELYQQEIAAVVKQAKASMAQSSNKL